VKFFNTERQKTNAESLIGECAVVTEEVDTLQAKGTVVIRGMEWSAKTDDPDGKIEKGKTVTVDGIQGVKLIVRDKEVSLC
jgi:membrane protein implicated in regulation of membrane protease activity